MELGMPTLIENKNLKENAKLCSQLGLNFLELNMNLPMFQLEEIRNTQNLLDISNEYNIYYTIHLDENLNISDFNQAVTKAYLDTVSNTIEIAKALHIPLINMHMNKGIYVTLPDKKIYLFDQYKDWYLQKILSFRELCEREIGNNSLFISIENTDGYLPFQKQAIDLLLESKVFCLTWDIGHSYAASEIDEGYIMKHIERLAHFHIHDAINNKNHLALGTGEIDLHKKFHLAKKHNCRCVLETKTIESLQESVKWIEQYNILNREENEIRNSKVFNIME